ncbi:MAG: protein translocase subunit SecF [Fidelibacterota bacterium]
MKFLKETHVNFLSMRKYGFGISGTVILAGLVSLLLKGGPALSIDFQGGTLVQIRFEKEVNIPTIREGLATLNLGKSDIQTFGDPHEILIRLQRSQDAETLARELRRAFLTVMPNQTPDFRRVETVGPKIGAELSGKAVLAILSAIIGILIYISIRFELKFAVGAIGALVHDVSITLGIFSILDYEVSLAIIAAFLTIVGYSLNDTIVVFDRIRENLKRLRQEPYVSIVNRSINESLSRTIITSLTTFVVVFTLWIAGGEVIKYFAFAMMVGVIVGTYSSIFIASPMIVLWQERLTGTRAT